MTPPEIPMYVWYGAFLFASLSSFITWLWCRNFRELWSSYLLGWTIVFVLGIIGGVFFL